MKNDAVTTAAATDIESQQSALPEIVECPEPTNTVDDGQLMPREAGLSYKAVLQSHSILPHISTADFESQRSPVPEIEECPEPTNTDEVRPSESQKSSFKRRPSLLRTRSRSRWLESQNSLRGIENSSDEEEEEGEEEDLPEDYKTTKISVCSVIQLMILIILSVGLACSLTIDALKLQLLFDMELWKWNLMALVVISGRLVAGWGVRVGVYFMERNFVLRKRVLYFVYGLKTVVQNFVWLTMGFIAWQWVFDENVARLTNTLLLVYITRFWVCVLVGTLICLVKTLAVKVLASRFHVSTYFDKIQESLFSQYVIEALSGAPLVKTTVGAGVGAAEKKKERNGINIEHLHKFNQRNISAWNMKKLMSIVKQGVFSTLDDKIQGSTDEATVHITTENQAKAAARKVFLNVANPESEYIYMEDLTRFMREGEAEALKTTQLFETGKVQNGISKHALKNWMVSAFRERRALAFSLNDTNTAVKKLHHMLNIFVGILIIVISLLILRIATKEFFILLGSQIVLVAFVFGDTCKAAFESIIFLFVMHPFDVGDRVEIDGTQMVVQEMNILTTVFLRHDNYKIWFPNSVLATKTISIVPPSISTT